MPYSYGFFDREIKTYILGSCTNVTILDVGPGTGKYGRMLRKHCDVDALEIYEPYDDPAGVGRAPHRPGSGRSQAVNHLGRGTPSMSRFSRQARARYMSPGRRRLNNRNRGMTLSTLPAILYFPGRTTFRNSGVSGCR